VKVGDLVEPAPIHGLKNQPYRKFGIVIEYLPETTSRNEAVVVRWNDGENELEVPGWLEIINESR